MPSKKVPVKAPSAKAAVTIYDGKRYPNERDNCLKELHGGIAYVVDDPGSAQRHVGLAVFGVSWRKNPTVKIVYLREGNLDGTPSPRVSYHVAVVCTSKEPRVATGIPFMAVLPPLKQESFLDQTNLRHFRVAGKTVSRTSEDVAMGVVKPIPIPQPRRDEVPTARMEVVKPIPIPQPRLTAVTTGVETATTQPTMTADNAVVKPIPVPQPRLIATVIKPRRPLKPARLADAGNGRRKK